MAGEASGSFLPLEGLGGNRTNYGVSGAANHLTGLTGSGATYYHSSAALTVPMQTVVITAGMGGTFSADLRVPRQIADGDSGSDVSLTVPMQVLDATGTVDPTLRCHLTVPMQVLAASGLSGATYATALRVPLQIVEGQFGWTAALAVPAQTVAAQVSVMESSTFKMTVPLQSVSGTFSTTSSPGYGAVVVPMIVAGPYGSVFLSVPVMQVAGQVGSTFTASADFEGWAMNVRNGGVTRWTNYPFTQFARAGKETYAVGADGNLYLLGGDLDVTAPIAWEFETGLENLDSPGLKHIPYLYMDGIIDGNIEIVLLDDRGREFAYEYDTKDRGAVHQQHRRKLGNGIRTVNVGFRFRSTSGAYIELDSFSPEATVTQRNL